MKTQTKIITAAKMIHIDSLILDEFFKENKDFFENAKVQKIQQPTRREIILQMRKFSENGADVRKFYININPEYHHICFMNKETEKRRCLEIPKQPPMFCMLLRKHMEGAKILYAQKPENERILELYFENYNEIGDRIEECLSIELMGKHSNIVLYNTDNNIILGCAHNIGAEKSKERELAGGLPYIYPPKQNKKKLLQTRFDWFESALLKSEDSIKKAISSRYFSLSQILVEDICKVKNIDSDKQAKSITKEEAQILFIELHEFMEKETHIFSVSQNYEKYSCIEKLERQYNSVNELIDDYFSYHIEKNIISGLKTGLNTKINKELKKLNNTLRSQQKQIDKEEKAKNYMLKGNLLTANAYALKTGEKSVLLKDYDTGKMIEIDLDENLTPIENANRYFALYNKTKKACQIANEMSEATKNEIDYFKEIQYNAEIAASIEELKETVQELESEKPQEKNKKQKETINIEKREIDGFIVYIGKNHKQNDYLYSKISSPNDLWFHALNTPGSHIIAKNQNRADEIQSSTLLKIAKLAKEFSSAKNSSKVPVVYTQRKYIKRPQNTKSGFVVYKNETEIVVN